MAKVFSIDAKKCTGCKLCELICSFHHNGVFKPSVSRIRVKLNTREGTAQPLICRQCKKCTCIEVCRPGAISQDEKTGVITIDHAKCTGCKECIFTCPFQAVGFEEEPKGVAIVCDHCGGKPECVKVCFPGALKYIDKETSWAPTRQDTTSRA
ncbi:MAG: 4Fe-4S dicluster domain-containing protein [Chloroflexi bacterium]|nr:4Fe-4S dicluster domain-containing protein [Chloroflexota bacterium]